MWSNWTKFLSKRKLWLNFKLWRQTKQEHPRTVGSGDAISAKSDTQWVNNFHSGDIFPMIFNDIT